MFGKERRNAMHGNLCPGSKSNAEHTSSTGSGVTSQVQNGASIAETLSLGYCYKLYGYLIITRTKFPTLAMYTGLRWSIRWVKKILLTVNCRCSCQIVVHKLSVCESKETVVNTEAITQSLKRQWQLGDLVGNNSWVGKWFLNSSRFSHSCHSCNAHNQDKTETLQNLKCHNN